MSTNDKSGCQSTDLTIFSNSEGSDLPWCNKCNKPVDFCEVIGRIFSTHPSNHLPHTKPTGEKIITIRCHGEQFKVSNWRGVVPDDYVPYGCF